MARQEIPIIVLGADGRPYAGASVYVRTSPGGVDATVYQARTGGATFANPLTSDAQGRVTGWLDRGDYAATISSVAGLGPWVEEFPIVPATDVIPPILDTYANRPAGPTLAALPTGTRFFATDKLMEFVVSAGALVLVSATPARVTALPGSPVEGQRISLQAAGQMTTQGVRWEAVYDAALTRWSVLAAVPMFAEIGARESIAAAYGDLATVGPSLTVPVLGDYDVALEAGFEADSAGSRVAMSFAVGASAALDTDSVGGLTSVRTDQNPGPDYNRHARIPKTALAAGTVLTAKYARFVASAAWARNRRMWLIPNRLG